MLSQASDKSGMANQSTGNQTYAPFRAWASPILCATLHSVFGSRYWGVKHQ